MLKRFTLLLAGLLTMTVLADAGQPKQTRKDAPAKDAPVKDAPKKDAPKKDEVKKDEMEKDEIKKDEVKKDAPKDKKDAVKKDAPKKDAPKDKKDEPKELKGTPAKIAKIDLEKKTITVEVDKKTVVLIVTDTTKFTGPRGGASEDGLKDDRVFVGSEVRYVLDKTGKNLEELFLPIRIKK